MYTRCPSCLTCFRVTEHHLAIAGGKVRCGQCQLVFNATEHVIDDLPINQLNNPTSAGNDADTNKADATRVDRNEETRHDSGENNPVKEDQVNTRPVVNFEPEADEAEQSAESVNEDLQSALSDEPEKEISEKSDLEEEDNALDKEQPNKENKEKIKEEQGQKLSRDISEQIREEEFEIFDIDNELQDEKKIDNSGEKFAENGNNTTNQKSEEVESDSIYNGEAFEIMGSAPSLENTTTEQEAEDNDIPVQLRDDLKRLQQPAARRLHPLLSLLFILILFSISFLQLAYFRAFELTFAIPSATPYIEMFCEKVNCHYSGPLDKKKIQLLSRDVRVHPKEKKALLISAAMINNADFAQPYPDIKIRLSDISGNIVAERIFSSKTYIGSATNPFSLMKSKIPVHIKFEVVDPGKDAVNFEFSFL